MFKNNPATPDSSGQLEVHLAQDSYHVGYLLGEVIVDYKEGFKTLPEAIQEQLKDRLFCSLAKLREPEWIRPKDGSKVQWLYGRKWSGVNSDKANQKG